jgi:hypothetical protein
MYVECLRDSAHAYEQVRRRCVDLACKHRPEAERAALDAKSATEQSNTLIELSKDDIEYCGVDAEIVEMPAEEDEVFVPEFEEPTGKKIVMDWAPFHCPKD